MKSLVCWYNSLWPVSKMFKHSQYSWSFGSLLSLSSSYCLELILTLEILISIWVSSSAISCSFGRILLVTSIHQPTCSGRQNSPIQRTHSSHIRSQHRTGSYISSGLCGSSTRPWSWSFCWTSSLLLFLSRTRMWWTAQFTTSTSKDVNSSEKQLSSTRPSECQPLTPLSSSKLTFQKKANPETPGQDLCRLSNFSLETRLPRSSTTKTRSPQRHRKDRRKSKLSFNRGIELIEMVHPGSYFY